MIGVLPALIIVAGLMILLTWPLATYITHFSMLNGERKGDEPKPHFISFRKLKRKVESYKPDLITAKEYKGFLEWRPQGENLRSMFLIGMEITPIEDWTRMFSELMDYKSKLYWHASILRVDGELRWLSPIGYLLFRIYSNRVSRELPEDDWGSHQVEFQAAQKIFEKKHQDLVKVYNERHKDDK